MTKIRISLLPADLKRQSSMMKVWTILALILAIIALVLLAVNILFNVWLQTPVAELESLKSQNKSMTENIGRLSYIQEMFDEIENTEAIMINLKGNDPDYEYLIDETTKNLTTYGLNMSRMEIVSAGEGQGCKITGTAMDTEKISQWLEYAKGLEGVQDAVLTDLTVEPASGDTLIFHFKAMIEIAAWNRE